MFLAGVYSGVTIEPNTARDALVRIAFHQKQLAEIRRMHLMTLASAGAEVNAIKEKFEEFKESLYPPLEGDRAEKEADLHRAMADFDSISERFLSSAKDLKPLNLDMGGV